MIIAFIALFYLIIGSISDLKSREVLNYSNFSLIAIGFAFNIILAIIYSEYILIAESIAGFVICYIIAYIMYYTGQWGGGDAKLLMGLGALFGFQFSSFIPLGSISMPFIIEFFINTLLLGALYGMLWSFTLAIINIKKVSKELNKKLKEARKTKYGIWTVTVIAFVIALISKEYIFKVLFVIIGLFITMMFYVWNFTKVVEKTVMYKNLSPDKITEGEWIVDDLVIDKKNFIKRSESGIITEDIIDKLKKHKEEFSGEVSVEKKFLGIRYQSKSKITNLEVGFRLNKKLLTEKELISLKEKIRRNTLLEVQINRDGKKMSISPYELKEGDVLLEDIKQGFLITGPKDLGIENYQIDILKKLKSEGKIKTVLIKEGIPFVPSFLLGFVATVVFPGFIAALF